MNLKKVELDTEEYYDSEMFDQYRVCPLPCFVKLNDADAAFMPFNYQRGSRLLTNSMIVKEPGRFRVERVSVYS